MTNDKDLATARTLMADFGGAGGTADGLQRICAKVYAAVGIDRGEQLLARHSKDPNPGWRWLAEVSGEAARRQEEALLVAQIFAFTAVWRTTVAPKLGPADWIDCFCPIRPTICMRPLSRQPAVPAAASAGPVRHRQHHRRDAAGDLATYAATQVLKSPERYSDSLAVTAKEVLAPPATAAPSPARESASLLAPAVVRLDRVKKAVSEVGLRYVGLGEAVVGVGIGLNWSPTDWVVVSIAAGGIEDLVAFTAGVLKDVEPDRLRILDECNTRTRENNNYPVYLYDAKDGWDVPRTAAIPHRRAADDPGPPPRHALEPADLRTAHPRRVPRARPTRRNTCMGRRDHRSPAHPIASVSAAPTKSIDIERLI